MKFTVLQLVILLLVVSFTDSYGFEYTNSKGESVPHHVHHSAEYRRLENSARLERNLQLSGYQYLNSVLKEVKVEHKDALALPDLLGYVPAVSGLKCKDLSVASLDAQKGTSALSSSISGATISCTGIASLTKNGKSRTLEMEFGTAGNGLSMSLTQKYVVKSDGSKQLEIDNCDMDFVPSLQIVNQPDAGFFGNLLNGGINNLIRLLAPAVGGVVGGLVCATVENIGILNVIGKDNADAQGISSFIQSGGTNLPIPNLKQQNSQSTTTNEKVGWFNFAQYEDEKIAQSRYAKEELQQEGTIPSPFNFAESPVFNFLQAFINTYLGGPGKEPKNINRPVVNAAIEKIAIALGDPTGNKLILDSLLAALPTLSLPLFGALQLDVDVKSASIRGLNTFKVLDILRPTLASKTTLDNKISITDLGVDVAIDIALRPLADTVEAPLPALFSLTNAAAIQSLEQDGVQAWTVPTSMADLNGGSLETLSAMPMNQQVGIGKGPSVSMAGIPAISDSLSFAINLQDMVVDMATMIAIDTKKVGEIPVRGLLAENILDVAECLTTPLYAIQLATFAAAVKFPANFLDLNSEALGAITDFISNAINALVGIVQDLSGAASALLGLNLGQLLSGILQKLLNNLLETLTGSVTVDEACGTNSTAFVQTAEVQNSGDIQKLLPIELDFLFNKFLTPNGDLGFNRMMEIVTVDASGTSGLFEVKGNTYSGSMRDLGIANDATYSATVDLSVSNLTSIAQDSTIMGYPGPLLLSNIFSLGPPIDLFAKIVLDISGEMFTDGKPTHNEYELKIGLGTIGADSTAKLQLQLSGAGGKVLSALTGSPCPLEVVQQFAVLELDLSKMLQDVDLRISCTGSCSTTAIDALGSVLKDPATKTSVNNYLQVKLIPFLANVLSDAQTWQLVDDNLLKGPVGDCSYREGVSSGEALVGIIVTAVALTFVGLLSIFFGVLLRKHRNNKRANDAARRATWRMSVLQMKPETSLCFHPAIKKGDKIAVVLGSALVLTQFVIALLGSVDTTISMIGTYTDGSTKKLSPDFGTGGGSGGSGGTTNPVGLIDIFINGEAYLLVACVGGLSAALPFIWVMVVLFAYLAPLTVLSVPKRSNLLTLFSSLGKLTLFLPFTLLILIVALRVNLAVSDGTSDVVALDLFISPSFGVFLFITAVLLMQMLTRRVIVLNRIVITHDGENLNQKPRSAPNVDEYKEFESVKEHTFAFTQDNTFAVFRVGPVGKLLSTIALPGIAVLIVIGSLVKVYSILYGGVVGSLVSIGTTEGFNLFEIIAIVESTVDVQADGASKLFFSIIGQGYVIASVFIIPLVVVGMLIYLTFKPISLKKQKSVFTTVQFVDAFAALDVMILTIFVMAMQVNTTLIQAIIEATPFVAFCGEDQTGEVPLVRSANNAGLTQNASSCLELSVVPLFGTVLLFLAALVYYIAYEAIMRGTNACIEDRDLQSTGSHFRTDAAFSKTTYLSRFAVKLFSVIGVLVSAGHTTGVVHHSSYEEEQRLKEGASSSMNAMSSSTPTPQPSYGGGGGFVHGFSRRFMPGFSQQVPSSRSNASNAELPPGWKQIYDPNTGRYYYANRVTGVVTWNVPQL